MIDLHFVDVGQGNMTVIIMPDKKVMVYDCNITVEREKQIFNYLKKVLPKNSIDVFVNSHRDADHMRGIKKLNKVYSINTLWDSGVSGNTETDEYKEYMDFRRNVSNVYEVRPGQNWKSEPNVKILNGKRTNSGDTNEQSIILHINHNGSSTLLAGDTDAKTWKDYIMPESKTKIPCDILLGSHHGSLSFFDDPRDTKFHYTSHIRQINPDISILSVGKNSHGHPDKKALEYYEKYSAGSNKGNKIFRTDQNGNIKVTLKGNGKWSIFKNQ